MRSSRRASRARLAEPNLVALSGDTASFLAGGEYPIPVPGALGTITIDYKHYGVGLAFTPTVLSGGLINMKIEPEVSQLDFSHTVHDRRPLGAAADRAPRLHHGRAARRPELRDRRPAAEHQPERDQQQLPWLGDVPVLGALFRSTSYQKNETDLAIIVTPRLVRPARPGDVIKTPLDTSLPANDVDLFLMGKTELHARQGAARQRRRRRANSPAMCSICRKGRRRCASRSATKTFGRGGAAVALARCSAAARNLLRPPRHASRSTAGEAMATNRVDADDRSVAARPAASATSPTTARRCRPRPSATAPAASSRRSTPPPARRPISSRAAAGAPRRPITPAQSRRPPPGNSNGPTQAATPDKSERCDDEWSKPSSAASKTGGGRDHRRSRRSSSWCASTFGASGAIELRVIAGTLGAVDGRHRHATASPSSSSISMPAAPRRWRRWSA